MRDLASRLLLKTSLLFSLCLFNLGIHAQESRTTILSFGHAYFTDIEYLTYGIHGIEASAEFLLKEEKIGLRLPLNLYYEEDLYLGGGINLKFYLNKGKFRTFIGPEYSMGKQITNKYPEDFLEKIRYKQLMVNTGVAYHAKWLSIAVHTGWGREFNYEAYTATSSITFGVKF